MWFRFWVAVVVVVAAVVVWFGGLGSELVLCLLCLLAV